MSADNVLGWEIVLKISHLVRFSAKCSFFGQSLSRGHYQPTYKPPEGVYLLNTNNFEKKLMSNFSRLLNASAPITFWMLHVRANFVPQFPAQSAKKTWLRFQWKVMENFRNRIKTIYGVFVPKSLSLKRYFEKDSFLLFLCSHCTHCQNLGVVRQIPYEL